MINSGNVLLFVLVNLPFEVQQGGHAPCLREAAVGFVWWVAVGDFTDCGNAVILHAVVEIVENLLEHGNSVLSINAEHSV